MIELRNISKFYKGEAVLDSFSATLPDDGFVAVTGASGIGKTTLLNIIAGLVKPDSGEVIFSGQADASGRISMVFQEDRLLERENAVLNAAVAFSKDFPNIDMAVEMLKQLGLGGDMFFRVSELSGGQRRRVAIARALAAPAPVYLMDEPLKGLDPATRRAALDVILRHTSGALLVMVTHDADDAARADLTINL